MIVSQTPFLPYKHEVNVLQVVLGVDNETKLRQLSEKLKEGAVDHKLWVEQPENTPTCLVTKPYVKQDISRYFKKLKLLKTEESQPSTAGENSS